MKFVKVLMVLAMACMLVAPASAADVEIAKKSTINKILESGELRVGFDASYAPFEITDKNGRYIGFDIDLSKELAKAMGVKFVPVNTDFDGVIPSLLSNKFDVIISGMTLTQKRNLQIGFSTPYFEMGQGVMISNKLQGKISRYKDLNNPKYVVVSRLGTTGEEAVRKYLPKATYKSFEKEVDCGMEVIAGRADAFVFDIPALENIASVQGKGKVTVLADPFTFEPMAIGFKQGDPDFANFLNNFVYQFKKDGRYQRLYDKWFKSDAWKTQLKK